MTSEDCGFRVSKRGFNDTIVLIPGWATDYRIFSRLDLNYNYIFPEKPDPLDFSDRLSSFLKRESVGRVSLLGWSLGGFLAVEFALKNAGRVDELILLGVRRSFDPAVLDEVRRKISENRRAYLFRFYLDCFSEGDKEGLAWFRRNLMKSYLAEMGPEYLMAGLDYFYKARIDSGSLAAVRRLRVFHGAEDRIAPFKEAADIENSLPGLKLIAVQGAGHAVFLNRGFKEKFENG